MGIEGINHMGIFGFFEDKKIKEELKAANEQIALLQEKLKEAEKRNEELRGLIASVNALNDELKKENESLKRTKSYGEEADELIANAKAITPNQADEYKPVTKKGKHSSARKQKSKKSNTSGTILNKEETANAIVTKADAGKPKIRVRKPKSITDVANTSDKKITEEKNQKNGENVESKDAILNKEEKPKNTGIKVVDKPKKRERKPKSADGGTKIVDKDELLKASKPVRKARAKKKPVKDESIESKPVVREEEMKVAPTETVATVESMEAAVMGIDEYEDYDTVKPVVPANKPKRKYTRRKPVGDGKAAAKASKTKKMNQSVKAVKPGKIESYADMLAITQRNDKNK